MFKKLIKMYQDYIKREQIRKAAFLLDKAAEHYYRNLSREPQELGNVTLPYFFERENLRKLSYTLALNELKKVIAECRVDACYKKYFEIRKGLINA